MRIAVPAETDPSEHRVAATPETVKRFKALGAEVVVQSGAGRASGFADDAFGSVGATIAHGAARRSASRQAATRSAVSANSSAVSPTTTAPSQ